MDFQHAIIFSQITLILAALCGLAVRRRLRVSYFFTSYLIVALATALLITIWPTRFLNWEFFLIHETAHNLIKFGIALELGLLTFKAMPIARASARVMTLAILLVML